MPFFPNLLYLHRALESDILVVEEHTLSCFRWKLSGTVVDAKALPVVGGCWGCLLRQTGECNILKIFCTSLKLADWWRGRDYKIKTVSINNSFDFTSFLRLYFGV